VSTQLQLKIINNNNKPEKISNDNNNKPEQSISHLLRTGNLKSPVDRDGILPNAFQLDINQVAFSAL
jgi:hypothetical protein